MNETPRNPSRATALLITVATALVFISMWTRTAFADERPRDLDVRFTTLDVKVEHGKLQVTYEIDRKDWRQLDQAHIRPRLNLYTPTRPGVFEFAQSVPVTSRTATVMYPRDITPDRGRFIELRLSGERRHTKIASTSYHEACGTRVRVAVERDGRSGHGRDHDGHDGRGHGHGHGGYAQRDEVAVIEACSKNTSWSGDLNQCIARATKIDDGAPATINACGASTSWSGDFMTCLDLAANLEQNRPGTIRACSDATSWSGDFKSCLESAAAYRTDATETIAACKAATSWSGDFKVCVDEARFLGPRAPRVVNACDAATSWSGEFKDCLVAARRG